MSDNKLIDDKAIDDYIDFLKEKDYKPKSIRNYVIELRSMQSSIGRPLTELSATDLKTWFEDLPNTGLAAATIGRKIIVLRQFYKYCLSKDLILRDPTITLQAPKEDEKEVKYLTDHEEKALIGPLKEAGIPLRDTAIMKVGLHTGITADETINLDVEDISLENREILIRSGRRSRVLPIPDDLYDSLYRWIDEHPSKEGALFNQSLGTNRTRLTQDSGRRVLGSIGQRMGITSGKLGFSILRKTYAKNLFKSEMPIDRIQYLLGHTDLATTMKFFGVDSNLSLTSSTRL